MELPFAARLQGVPRQGTSRCSGGLECDSASSCLAKGSYSFSAVQISTSRLSGVTLSLIDHPGRTQARRLEMPSHAKGFPPIFLDTMAQILLSMTIARVEGRGRYGVRTSCISYGLFLLVHLSNQCGAVNHSRVAISAPPLAFPRRTAAKRPSFGRSLQNAKAASSG
jgi:hypothetical protein